MAFRNMRFIKSINGLLLVKQKIMVVGDLHIGKEVKLRREGVHFRAATKELAEAIHTECTRNRATKLVILGDIKDSIGYPDHEEYKMLREFFEHFKNIDVYAVKGNHDAHLEEVFKQISFDAEAGKEIIIGDYGFIHGNAMPSESVMQCKCIFAAHMHAKINVKGEQLSPWIVAKIDSGAKKYKTVNKDATLMIAPASSNLAIGRIISPESKERFPLFRNKIFSFATAKVYTTDGKGIGILKKFLS